MTSAPQIRVGLVGATGMVGQRFIVLLQNHPTFKITTLASSARSAGQKYGSLMTARGSWAMSSPIPADVADMVILDASNVDQVAATCDFVFCAVDMPKPAILALEEQYAKTETPVVSNNSAARGVDDVPMMIPEVNPQHTDVIDHQRKRLGTSHGFIAVKPNCSIQSYVPPLTPLLDLGLENVIVSTYQAISGAGKTFDTWPEMVDNVVPYIGGEEQKSEREPLKVWGSVADGKIVNASTPKISAQCIRVPVCDGHMATVSVQFKQGDRPTIDQIKAKWNEYNDSLTKAKLHSSPHHLITYFEEQNRPQTRLDRDIGNGMGVSVGRLREDNIFDYKFVCLSHNTVRGAAGGAILTAEMLFSKGYIVAKDASEQPPAAKRAKTDQ